MVHQVLVEVTVHQDQTVLQELQELMVLMVHRVQTDLVVLQV